MSPSLRRRTVLRHALALGALPAFAHAQKAATKAATAPGRMLGPGDVLPDVAMSGLNAPDSRLAAYSGRPLIVNVWASWCGPCRAEAASLERLAWSPAGQQFTVIGVSTDDYRDKALQWLKQSNATLNHYIDQRLVLEHLLGADKIPTTVLFDAKGRFVERHYGAREWDSPESVALIRRAFAAGTVPKPARKRP